MRTTVDLPDSLYDAAKVAAAQRRTTLRELLLRGLEQVLAQPVTDSAPAQSKNKLFLDSLKASNTHPVRPLSRTEIYDERIRQ